MIMLLSALKYITLNVVKNMTVVCIKIYNFKGNKKYDRFMSLIFNFCEGLQKWASFPSLKAHNLVK